MQKFLETLGEIFIEWIIPLSTYGLLFVGFVLFGTWAVKHSWRRQAKVSYEEWLPFKRTADSLIASLPDSDTLQDEYLLHTAHLKDVDVVRHRQKFIMIGNRLQWAAGEYANEITKHDITLASSARAITISHNRLRIIINAFHACESDLISLWHEIADPSLPISNLTELKTKLEADDYPAVVPRRQGDSLIQENSFFGDSVNAIFLLPPWRPPHSGSNTKK